MPYLPYLEKTLKFERIILQVSHLIFGVKYLKNFNSYPFVLICSKIEKEKRDMFILAPKMYL